MKSLTLVFTLAAAALSVSALSNANLHSNALGSHHGKRLGDHHARSDGHNKSSRRRKRSTCAATSSVSASSSLASSSSAAVVKTSSTFVAHTTSTSSSNTWTSTSSSAAAASSSSTSTGAGGNTYTGSGHTFVFTNQCSNSVVPVLVDVSGVYDGDSSSTKWSSTLNSLAAGSSFSVTVPSTWNGRVFAEGSACGSLGEDCTMGEFNLGANSFYTPNSWDVSIIQGFSSGLSVSCNSETAICTSADCTCPDSYPIGDESGCGDDSPVKATGSGDQTFEVVFCPS